MASLLTILGVLRDMLSGGVNGWDSYPLNDISKLKKGDTLNLLFTGASTGYTPDNSRWKTLKQSLNDTTAVQAFRYGLKARALLWLKSLPKDVKLNVIGYSQGADAANAIARKYKAPISLIDPVTSTPRNTVPWAQIYYPTKAGMFEAPGNFLATLMGRVDQKLAGIAHKYLGTHNKGVNAVLLKILGAPGLKPSQKHLQFLKKRPTELIDKLYKYGPAVGGVISGVGGYTLSGALGVKLQLLKMLAGGISGLAGYHYTPKLIDKFVPVYKETNT